MYKIIGFEYKFLKLKKVKNYRYQHQILSIVEDNHKIYIYVTCLLKIDRKASRNSSVNLFQRPKCWQFCLNRIFTKIRYMFQDRAPVA